MAKNNKNSAQRQGRRIMPAVRRTGVRARAAGQKVSLTIGDLIAAAFDAANGKSSDVASILGSAELAAATGRKIVLF